MKVCLTTARGGNGFSQKPGEVIDVSTAEARRLIEGGHAVPVEEFRTATVRPPQNAARRTKTKGR